MSAIAENVFAMQAGSLAYVLYMRLLFKIILLLRLSLRFFYYFATHKGHNYILREDDAFNAVGYSGNFTRIHALRLWKCGISRTHKTDFGRSRVLRSGACRIRCIVINSDD